MAATVPLPPGWTLHQGSRPSQGRCDSIQAVSPSEQFASAATAFARHAFGHPAVGASIRLADGRRCRIDFNAEPVAVMCSQAATSAASSLLSTSGKKIVEAIAAGSPIEAKAIPAAVGIDRSKVYVLLGDMAERGIIRLTADGYVIADAAVLKCLREVE